MWLVREVSIEAKVLVAPFRGERGERGREKKEEGEAHGAWEAREHSPLMQGALIYHHSDKGIVFPPWRNMKRGI